MTQPKYISIFKMSIIHAIAFTLSIQVYEGFSMIEYLDCWNITQGGTIRTKSSCNPSLPFYAWYLLLLANLILLFLSNLKTGNKWHLILFSILVCTIFTVIKYIHSINIYADLSYHLLYSKFDFINIYLKTYFKIVFVSCIVLFLYFGKPVINFIKNEDKSISDRRLYDILDT